MRHRIFGKKLNRDIKQRKALFKGLILSLIRYGKIRTTYSRAKAVVGLIDKLVTYAKDGSQSTLRKLTSFLARKEAIERLLQEIAPRFSQKTGGYSRMIRVGRRSGDKAEEVVLEWSVEEEKKAGQKKIKGEALDKKVKGIGEKK